MIHDQLDPPVADTNGMLIGPGIHASIGFKKQKVSQNYFSFARPGQEYKTTSYSIRFEHKLHMRYIYHVWATKIGESKSAPGWDHIFRGSFDTKSPGSSPG